LSVGFEAEVERMGKVRRSVPMTELQGRGVRSQSA
jgi:hypothetical protein